MAPDEVEHAPDRARSSLAFTLLFGAFFVWNSLYFWPYLIDDTFISLRYAANLVAGDGLVYNVGERVEGYSNFSWVMLGAAALRLGLPPVTTLKVLGMLAGLGVVVGTSSLGRRLFARCELPGLRTILATAFVALHTSLAVWSQAGLETVFFALLLVLTALRFERELEDARARPWSALLFALAWMTRPEAPVYLLYLVVRRLFALRARALGRYDVTWWLLLLGLVLPYEAFGLWYYGHLFPMTYQAKVGPADPEKVAAVGRLFTPPLLRQFWTQQGLGFQGLVVAGLAGCALGWRRLPLAAVLIVLGGLTFVVYARTDWMPRHRFLVPILAFLGLLLAHGLGELVSRLRARAARGVALALVLLLLGDYARVQILGGHTLDAGAEEGLAQRRRGIWFGEVPAQLGERIYPQEMEALTILTQVAPDAVLCMRDIGFVGYLTMNPVWDTAGLFTPTVAAARHDPRPEASARMLADLREVAPQCIYLVLSENEHLSIDDRIDRWLRTDPEAKAAYGVTLRRGRPRDGKSTVLYVRRGRQSGTGEQRVDERLAQWPEYADRARAIIAEWKSGGGR